jgi:hypothetical protein
MKQMSRSLFYGAFAMLIVAKARAIAQIITVGATHWGHPLINGECPLCRHRNPPIKAPPCSATLTTGETVKAFCPPQNRACVNCTNVFAQQPEE